MVYRTFFLFLFTFSFLIAQDNLEIIQSQQEETYYPTEIVEFLQNTKINPLNINTITEDELFFFPWLSDQDINKILTSRRTKTISGFSDLTELGLDAETIEHLADYITFSSKKSIKIEQTSRVEYQQAKDKLPSTLKYLQKTLANFKNTRVGVITQKDEGEKDLLDYYSCFIEYSTEKNLKKLLIGKYRLSLGQGILFASKLGMSKSSAATTNPIKKFNPLKSYTSSYEIGCLEGAALNYKAGAFNIISFFSRTSLTANLDTLDQITSFNESGLHFDPEERNNVLENIYGLAAKFEHYDNSFGINCAKFSFDHSFNDPAKKDQYEAISADMIIGKTSTPIFGEFAFADKKAGGLLGIKYGDIKLKHLLLTRYYDKDFPTWHGNPFSSQSNFDNEIGLYYGLAIRPGKSYKVNCYFDIWSFPKTRYFEKMPTVGSEEFIQLEKKFNKNTICFSIHHKDKEKYIALEGSQIRDFERTTFRADFWQNINNFRFKTRCELATEYLPTENIYKSGFLAYEEVKWKSDFLTLIGQITVYHSDVLHYMYEHNVDGIMQNTIFSGDGIYSYFVVKYNVLQNMKLQFKVSDHWSVKDKLRLYFQVISYF
ncbi:MAG: hypothetical protein K9N07_08285 [Candidatus Cloacimonetes bacterium]|nr:hypothetical protein [Candidatus Cloacimonadota bacterium]